jgi:hypothetical protein
MNIILVIIYIISFLIGCINPLLFSFLLHSIYRNKSHNFKLGIVYTFFIYGLCLTTSLCAIGYLATFNNASPRVIIVLFLIGFGLVRWYRNEL